MTHQIEKLEPSKHVQGRILVWFAGESEPLRVTESEALSFALYAGMTLSDEVYGELLRAAGAASARNRAAEMLSRRPLSRRELIRRLEEKGEKTEDAVAAADRMEELGALDDLAYARTLVRYYTDRGWGVQKLKSELSRRGIPREFWEEALSEQADPAERIVNYLSGRGLTDLSDPDERRRVANMLMRRGFTWEEISAGLRQLEESAEEESV